MHPDHLAHTKYTGRARLDKSINSLLGIVEGIAIDGLINSTELGYFEHWLTEHRELHDRHPFNELAPVVMAAMADGVLTQEEREDIVWLCERLRSEEFYDRVSADLQRLHAILGGIIADARISEGELRGLSDWMDEHEHLRTCWPFDEIGSLITEVLRDGKIDETEHQTLLSFFSEFVGHLDERTITSAPLSQDGSIVGLCAVNPQITFTNCGFCFTGASSRMSRAQLEAMVSSLGGKSYASPSKNVHYLVIGSEGNPCWAYACYGRKVEKAVELRKAGVRVAIIHEVDFHDAVRDYA
jgi:hypothetical protein